MDDESVRLQVHVDQLDRVYRRVFRDNVDGWEFDADVDHWGCIPGVYLSTRPWITCLPVTHSLNSTQKTVYSVFQYNPPAIGFAALSEVAIAENGVNGAVPSATIGSVSAEVTSTNGAVPRVELGRGVVLGVGVLATTMVLLVL